MCSAWCFTKGALHYVDAMTHVDASADIDTIDADPTYGVSWKLRGKWNRQDISGSGKAGAVLSLQQQGAPFPLTANSMSAAPASRWSAR
jgi:uncharacterized protein involved in outer membrane biogenesis